jgi:hypothetical protein
MTPHDIVGLAPHRRLMALVALILAGMAGCFWTPEIDPESVID